MNRQELLDSLYSKLPFEAVEKVDRMTNFSNKAKLELVIANSSTKQEADRIQHINNQLRARIEEQKIFLAKVDKIYSDVKSQIDNEKQSVYNKNISSEVQIKRDKLAQVIKMKEKKLQMDSKEINLIGLEEKAKAIEDLKTSFKLMEAEIAKYEGIPCSSADAELAVEGLNVEVNKMKTELDDKIAASLDSFYAKK